MGDVDAARDRIAQVITALGGFDAPGGDLSDVRRAITRVTALVEAIPLLIDAVAGQVDAACRRDGVRVVNPGPAGSNGNPLTWQESGGLVDQWRAEAVGALKDAAMACHRPGRSLSAALESLAPLTDVEGVAGGSVAG